MKKITVGAVIGPRSLETVESGPIEIPHPRDLVHLQFRRFAGCPFCSLHLRDFVRRHDELAGAGIREVVVFRSTASALRQHHADMPFAIVPDRKAGSMRSSALNRPCARCSTRAHGGRPCAVWRACSLRCPAFRPAPQVRWDCRRTFLLRTMERCARTITVRMRTTNGRWTKCLPSRVCARRRRAARRTQQYASITITTPH